MIRATEVDKKKNKDIKEDVLDDYKQKENI